MRNYKRKSVDEPIQQGVLINAAKEIKINGKSVRGTAKDFCIPETSLRRFCKKTADVELLKHDIPPKKHSRQVMYKFNNVLNNF